MGQLFIIGAGASGLMAAISAARKGADVTVIEQNKRPGRKLLASGNGKCNLTNTGAGEDNYRGTDPAFAQMVLGNVSVNDTLDFFREIGLLTVSHGGWIYPYTEQSLTVLKLLLRECTRLGVRIRTDTKVTAVRRINDRFRIETHSWDYDADAVILSCGSAASEVEGSSAQGLTLAESLGHGTIPFGPALTSLNSSDPRITRWGGARAYASVTLTADGREYPSRSGQVQLIDRGLSGIPVFQVSRYAVEALRANRPVTLEVDFMPDIDEDALTAWLRSRTGLSETHDPGTPTAVTPRAADRSERLSEALLGLLPDKLIDVFKMYAHTEERLAASLKHFKLRVTGTGSLKHSQVASGGVRTDEVDPDTMASKIANGLFLTGELLDIAGDCGGWNLQFAWSTGMIAGRSAAAYLAGRSDSADSGETDHD